MTDKRIGKKVKTVTVFYSALISGCDFFIQFGDDVRYMTNEQAQNLTVVQLRSAVKADRLRLSKKRRKGVQYGQGSRGTERS